MTGDLIDAVLASTQIDLVPDDLNYEPILNAVRSHRKLGAVLWECVKGQAESQDDPVDRNAFLGGFDGQAYIAGWEALVQAIYFFIHCLSASRAAAFQAMIEAGLKLIEAEAKSQIEMLKSRTTDVAIQRAVEKIQQQMQQGLVKDLDKYASNLPRASALTPESIPSANLT